MLEIPFSTGIVAGFLFLIFELFVFPVVTESTSKVASLLLNRKFEKGKSVQVKGLKFKLWNEGLLHRYPSHLLLLLIRVLCVALPVYLETRLESTGVPILVSKRIENAFVAEPRDDWIIYQSELDPIIVLRDNAETVFDRCVDSDENGFVTAKTANVTYNANRLVDNVKCIESTSKRLFRYINELPPFVIPSELPAFPAAHKTEAQLSISWIQGPVLSFQPSPDRERFEDVITEGNDYGEDLTELFQVTEVRVLNMDGIECFTENSLQTVFGEGTPVVKLMCQNVTANNADFYSAGTNSIEVNNNSKMSTDNNNLTSANGTMAAPLYFVGRLQFEEQVIFNAGHFVNVDFITDPPLGEQDFRSIVRRILYSKADNITARFPTGKISMRTTIDKPTIILGGLEISVTAFRHAGLGT
ncbi:hypothetical protein FGB62_20g214 [Gracilaria domingensis]|nr:hypothetical protein FGB62_20g214 [Gracilaria domingensis]